MIKRIEPGLTHYECVHFEIDELVPRWVFEKYGKRAWQFFHPHLLYGIDLLREEFGRITINTWKWGNINYTQSGLRDFDFNDAPTQLSLHKLGKAMDLKFKDYSVDHVTQCIINNKEKYWMFTGIELNTHTWLHVDVRNVNTDTEYYLF